jgi:hypothetical protein
MTISHKAVQLAAYMMAATKETSGEWFVSPSSGAVAEYDRNADPNDVEYYGGKLICEGAGPTGALGIVACQPNNVRVVCSELLRLAEEEHRGIRLKCDTTEAINKTLAQVRENLTRIEDAINDDIPF